MKSTLVLSITVFALITGFTWASTIAESVNAVGMEENEAAGKKGGGIAKKARLELEEKTGKRVVTGQNFLPPKAGKKLSGK